MRRAVADELGVVGRLVARRTYPSLHRTCMVLIAGLACVPSTPLEQPSKFEPGAAFGFSRKPPRATTDAVRAVPLRRSCVIQVILSVCCVFVTGNKIDAENNASEGSLFGRSLRVRGWSCAAQIGAKWWALICLFMFRRSCSRQLPIDRALAKTAVARLSAVFDCASLL